MSNETSEARATGATEQQPKASKIEITPESLQTLLAAVVSTAVEKAVEKTSEITARAIEESKKPYVDPAQKINQETMKRTMRLQHDRAKRNDRIAQRNCPHMQGCSALSEFSGPLTSIVMHRLDTGEVIGICTNCLRVFRATDQDYAVWMQKKSGNKLSSSGQRYMVPLGADEELGLD